MDEDELYLFLALGYAVSPYTFLDAEKDWDLLTYEKPFTLADWLDEIELGYVINALNKRFHRDTVDGCEYYPKNSVGLIVQNERLLHEFER